VVISYRTVILLLVLHLLIWFKLVLYSAVVNVISALLLETAHVVIMGITLMLDIAVNALQAAHSVAILDSVQDVSPDIILLVEAVWSVIPIVMPAIQQDA